jgi:hypothetical protein
MGASMGGPFSNSLSSSFAPGNSASRVRSESSKGGVRSMS